MQQQAATAKAAVAAHAAAVAGNMPGNKNYNFILIYAINKELNHEIIL